MLASGHPAWAWDKDTVLLYSIHYCTVKYTKAQPLVDDAHTWQCTPDTWTNLRDWTCERTFASLKVHNLKVRMQGTYCIHILSFLTWLATVIVTVNHLAAGRVKSNYWKENRLILCFYYQHSHARLRFKDNAISSNRILTHQMRCPIN